MYAVFERASGCYYHGNEWNEDTRRYRAVFGELDGRVRQYPTEKKAEAALRWIISAAGYDFPDALEIMELPLDIPEAVSTNDPPKRAAPADEQKDCLKCPYFLDKPAAEVRDKPEPEEPPPLYPVSDNDKDGWELIAFVGQKKMPPLMVRKQFGMAYSYAIKMPDGGFLYLPGDELLAWARYYDECKRFVCGRIRARRIREGRDPGGMDEWR